MYENLQLSHGLFGVWLEAKALGRQSRIGNMSAVIELDCGSVQTRLYRYASNRATALQECVFFGSIYPFKL